MPRITGFAIQMGAFIRVDPSEPGSVAAAQAAIDDAVAEFARLGFVDIERKVKFVNRRQGDKSAGNSDPVAPAAAQPDLPVRNDPPTDPDRARAS